MQKRSRNDLRLQRKKRISAKIKGTKECPRLSVFMSLKGIYAQVINDAEGRVLASASLKKTKVKGNNLESAKKIGQLIAKECLAKNIKKIVFDRSGYKYHGKVKALADGAREGGLKF